MNTVMVGLASLTQSSGSV